MLSLLGPDGMSSDEDISIPGSNRFQFGIHPLPFRSQPVTTWLRKLDKLSLIRRFADSTDQRRGNKPRERVIQAPTDTQQGTSRFVSGLPCNAYDENWIKSKGQAFVFYNVRPTPDHYDFSINEELEQYAY